MRVPVHVGPLSRVDARWTAPPPLGHHGFVGNGAALIDLVEACYRIDLSEQDWVAGIADAAAPVIATSFGTAAFTYCRTEAGTLDLGELALSPRRELPFLRDFIESLPPDFVRGWERPAGYVADDARFSPSQDFLHRVGPRDILAINGLEPSGHGVWLGAPSPKRGRLSRSRAGLLARVAAHAAAGYRVRRAIASRSAAREPEAVIAPGGRLEHAEGAARGERARDALRWAARQLDRARTTKGRAQGEYSVAGWTALVAGRWTLLDHFEADGRRYMFATSNEPATPEAPPPCELTPRERQVVAFAVLGHHNKLIAYELGLSASTVRVLLSRVGRKIGVDRRSAVVEAFAKWMGRRPGDGHREAAG